MNKTIANTSDKKVSFRSLENSPTRFNTISSGDELIEAGRTSNNNNRKFLDMRRYVKNPVERFLPDYKPNTGVNVKENTRILMNKEIIKPMTSDRKNIYDKPLIDFGKRKDKFALNIQLKCPNETYLPKCEPFKPYFFPYRISSTAEKYKRTYLNTDNIAIKYPKESDLAKIEKKDKFSVWDMKAKFNMTTESGSSFAPRKYQKAMSNKSSVNYNIISVKGEEGFSDNTGSVLERKILFKKKGIGEYKDLTKTYAINPGEKYLEAYNSNPHTFKYYKGIFSHLYDAAIRNGGLTMPFKKESQSKGGKRY